MKIDPVEATNLSGIPMTFDPVEATKIDKLVNAAEPKASLTRPIP